MARAYYPQEIDNIQSIWKEKLQQISPSAANALGSTKTHPDLFPKPIDTEYDDYKDDDIDDTLDLNIEEEEQEDNNNTSIQPSPTKQRVEEDIKEDDDNVPDEDEEEDQESSPMVTTAKRQSADNVDIDLSDEVSLPSGIDDDIDNGEDNEAGDDDDDDFNIDDLDNI